MSYASDMKALVILLALSGIAAAAPQPPVIVVFVPFYAPRPAAAPQPPARPVKPAEPQRFGCDVGVKLPLPNSGNAHKDWVARQLMLMND